MRYGTQKVRDALAAGRTPHLFHIRDLLTERDELASLVATVPQCAAKTPVHSSDCFAGLTGHTGSHRTAGGWTWT